MITQNSKLKTQNCGVLWAIILTILLKIFLAPASSSAFESEKGEPVKIKADRLEYIEEKNLVTGFGNVSITQGDTKLQGDYMEFWTDSDNIHAKGNVFLWQKDNTLKGEELDYNINDNKGTMKNSYSTTEAWIYRNEEVEQVSEDLFYASRQSNFTTCDKEDPHYRFKPKEIIIYPKRRLVCRDVSMLVRDVPVLHFPYYTKKLDKINQLHIKIGYSRRKGLIVRTKYDYSLGNNSYGNYYVDWWQFVGWGTGFNHHYSIFSGRGKGNIYLYFTKLKTENPADNYSYTGPEAEDWYSSCRYEHKIYEAVLFETAVDKKTGHELVKEKSKITVDGKINLNYKSNMKLMREVESVSGVTKEVTSSMNITTVRTPNIVFVVAGEQKNKWDDDLKKFQKTEEKAPDITFSLLPTPVMEYKTWRQIDNKPEKLPVNYTFTANYHIKYDRGNREDSTEVVKNDLNPDVGNTDIYKVKLSAFPSFGTIEALAKDGGNRDIPIEILSIDYTKKEVEVRNLQRPFATDPRDKIIIKYATKLSTQNANFNQSLMTSLDLYRGNILSFSLTPSIGHSEEWRDKKSQKDPNERRISSYNTNVTLSTRFTNYITWQNTHSYKKQWQEISDDENEDPYKGIVTNSVSTSLTLDSPFNEKTFLYRTSLAVITSYDLRSKHKSFLDTTSQKQKRIVLDEKEEVENKKSRFSDLLLNLRSRPRNYFELTSEVKYDIYCDSSDVVYPKKVQEIKKGKLKQITSTFHYFPNTYLDLTYRHELYYFYESTSFATIDSLVKVPISRYWEGSYLASFRNNAIYDPRLEDFKLDKHRVALKRDLHCWEAEFSIRKQMAKLGVPEEVEFWFVLNLKAFPERKMGLLGREKYIEIRDQI